MLEQQVTIEPKENTDSQRQWRWGRIVCGLSAIAICAKVIGFAEKIVIAHYFGTSPTADIYFAAMAVMLSVLFLIRELIYPTLLPVFSQTLQRSAIQAGYLFKNAFWALACVLVLVALLGMRFSNIITRFIVPGFSADQQESMANLLGWLALAVIFPGLMVVTYTTLNSRRRFLVSALSEMIFKGLTVAGLIMLLPLFGLDILGAVLAVAALVGLLIHLYFLDERRFIFRPDSGGLEPFKKVLLLMGPLVAGVVFSHISGLVDNMLASTLPSGRLSYLSYAKKITDAILLIGPVAIVTVVYSHASHLAAQGKLKDLTILVGKSIRILLYISVPISCMLIFLGEPILRCLFQHGQFDSDSTIGTSRVLLVYGLGLITFSLESLLVYSFFALSDTATPVKFGILCVLLDIVLAFVLLPYLQEMGIALALVVSKTIKVIILAHRLAGRLAGLWGLDIWRFLAKLMIATVGLGVILAVVSPSEPHISLPGIFLFELLLPSGAGVLVFLGVSWLLKVEQCRVMLTMVRNRIVRK